MKIVNWNCNGALRHKLTKLSTFEADIYVIQECEDPHRSKSDQYKEWAANCVWVGTNKNRGLGVFAKPDVQIDVVPLDCAPLELFLPCVINQQFNLLAAWTREANSPTFRYIGQLWKFLQRHESFLSAGPAALIGDLNSNACWDVWDRWWNHSDVVRQLRDLGLTSTYHAVSGEAQGKESRPTFYMNRKLSRPYHIDYAFLSSSLLKGATCEIGDPADWLEVSDHMPLVVETQ
ncbi:MAG: endonuclease/exonuclease/phosphatase family protein [Burkholderiales bacterium]|nr:endonuclease/exonuclease/phosphatase family protein [Burkholderiales bacterium]